MTASIGSRGGALVTGGARRIGRALSLAVAEAGFAVAVHVRGDHDEALDVVAEIKAAGGRAAVVAGDLTDEADLTDLVDRARTAAGPLRLLINNAALFGDDSFETMTAETFDRHMQTNLRAPVLLSQAFAKQVPDGAEGLIVNLLDQRVLRPTPLQFSYSVAKAALWQATRMMAQALAPRIRVNGVGPGPTLASIHQSPDDFAAEAAHVPLQRSATPEEIAEAVRYLIDARSVTGQIIAVDGGQHLGWRTPDVIGR